MTYAYRCPTLGPQFCDDLSPVVCECGETHEPYECGPPPKREGAPAIHCLKEFYSHSHNQVITSRRQEDQLDDAKGIATLTQAERRNFHPQLGRTTRQIMSYKGQKNRGGPSPTQGPRTPVQGNVGTEP